MKTYKQTDERYGDGGVFEATSKEAAAREMLPTFRQWKADAAMRGESVTIGAMVDEFIAGLEEVSPTVAAEILAAMGAGEAWTGATASVLNDDEIFVMASPSLSTVVNRRDHQESWWRWVDTLGGVPCSE